MKKILIFALIYRMVQYFFYYLLEQKNHVEDNIDYDFFLGNNHFLNYNLIYLGTSFLFLIAIFSIYKIVEYFSWRAWLFIFFVVLLLGIDIYLQILIHVIFYVVPFM